MLKVEKLNKFYNPGKANQIHVTNNISVEFESTGLVCILGESGCGKTTFVNEIGGLDSYIGGKITIDDKTIKKYNQLKYDKIRTKKFGYIFQNYYLLQDRSVMYNIELILDMYKLSDDEKKARMDYVLKAVDMEKYKKRVITQLSGGQQQRVAIARALAKSPSVIFADEPTGNLDVTNTLKVMTILKKISKSCLVILVTHDKSIANFFADRVIQMSDGKIIDDSKLSNKDNVYKYVDNSKLYLKEYNIEKIQNDDLDINVYNHNDKDTKINFKIVNQNDKIYIATDNIEEVVFLTGNEGISMVDEYIPKIEIQNINDSSYNLKKIDDAKTPRLRFKELINFAISSFKAMKKRRIILSTILLILSIFMSIFVSDWYTINNKELPKYVYRDPHMVKISCDLHDKKDEDAFYNMQKILLKDMLLSNENIEVYPKTSNTVYFKYKGFSQIENVNMQLDEFTYVNCDKISKKDLIAGRMPKAMNEVVIDKNVVDVMKDSDYFSSIINSYDYMIGKELKPKIKDSSVINVLKIVGVSDTNLSNIYITKNGLSTLSEIPNSTIGISELNHMTNNKYKDIDLKNNQALVSKDTYEIWKSQDLRYNPDNMVYRNYMGKSYKIVSTYECDELDNYVIVNDKELNTLFLDMGIRSNIIYLYAENPKETMKYIQDTLTTKNKDEKLVTIKVTYPYEEQAKKYEKECNAKIRTKKVVFYTALIISMVVLYFTFKSNVINRIKDISVYRLLGISRFNVILTFIIEIVIISTYTSTLGCLCTGYVINFISGIKSLNVNLMYPWYLVLLTIVLLFAINIIVGIIPVINILRLPPAKLASKYDM